MRANNFNLARMLLASAVLLSHSYALIGLHEPAAFRETLGTFAVHCFFVISGYLVAGSALNSRSIRSFVWKRALRIVPGLVIAYLFSTYAFDAFGYYDGNPVPYIANGSLWTLSWETMCYVLVVALSAVALLNVSTVGAVYAASAVLMIVAFSVGVAGINLVVAKLFFLFIGGMFVKLNESKISLQKLGIAGIVLIVLFDVPQIGWWTYTALKWIPFLYAPPIPFDDVGRLIYLIFLPFSVIYLCAATKPIRFVAGDYSYGTYIYAWPVTQIVVSVALAQGYALQPVTLFIISGLITLALAVTSWHFIEQPALRLKDMAPTRLKGET